MQTLTFMVRDNQKFLEIYNWKMVMMGQAQTITSLSLAFSAITQGGNKVLRIMAFMI